MNNDKSMSAVTDALSIIQLAVALNYLFPALSPPSTYHATSSDIPAVTFFVDDIIISYKGYSIFLPYV